MNLNPETLTLMLKFGGGMMGILLLVWGIAVIIPKLAAAVDRLFGLKPQVNRVNPEEFKVKDPWMGDLDVPDGDDTPENN